jgi:predicted RNA-binding Zn ribbon-like protein
MAEPLAIEFANTVQRRGMEYVELLGSPDDVTEWASREGLPLSARDAASRLGEVRALRDAVFALLRAAATPAPGATPPQDAPPPPGATPPQDASPPPDPEARLNAALAAVPLVPQLRDGTVVLTAPRDAPALDTLLARVAASALDVLRDPALAFCDAPSCGQFFLRHRGDQRWCGPACGTRARVARHAAHRR